MSPDTVAQMGRRQRGVLLTAFAVLLATSGAGYAETDGDTTREHVVSGFRAWAVAKNHGFTFQPVPHAPGQWVTEPRDGQNTRLLARTRNRLGQEDTVTLAQVAAGSASVNRPASGDRMVAFDFFRDRRLAPGWTVADMELIGRFGWVRQVAAGSRDLSFRVTASSDPSSTGSVMIMSVTLRGPEGADWQDAFRTAVDP